MLFIIGKNNISNVKSIVKGKELIYDRYYIDVTKYL